MTRAATDVPATCAPNWKMRPAPIQTRWAASVNPNNAWHEYPRPQMVRPQWQNLNGLWEYLITAGDAGPPEQYAGHILVPYPVESALSGVQQPLGPDQLLWYRRTVELARDNDSDRVLLHFGAVDHQATVFVNGQEIGSHCGGYQSFTFDISASVRCGANELVVKVHDPTDKGPNPHGKQKLHGHGMFYTPSSGIWQTVWLERVPSIYIQALKLTPDLDHGELRLEVHVNELPDGYSFDAIAHSGERVVARQTNRGTVTLRIREARLWSPDDPYLYDLRVRLLKGERVVDEVTSYFGMRKIRLQQDAEGRARIHLNNRYTYNLGVVDQGFWPDGLYTAPTDAALKYDIQAIKALGFNTVRKHIKVEPQRWYYHCDRLGLMVWQDMPFGPNDTPQARFQFEREIKENLAQLHNHPSITLWVLFNEGWGAYDPERITTWMKQIDPSRLVIGHSGPYDQVHDARWLKLREASRLLQPLGGRGLTVDDVQRTQFLAPPSWMPGDLMDVHIYPGPEMFPGRADKGTVTGEHGSFGVYIEGHVWDECAQVGLGVGASGMTPQQMLEAYANSIENLRALETKGLSGSGYFEIADVESEQQGFLTYDRAIAKVPVSQIARLNSALVPLAGNYDDATDGFFVESVDWTPVALCYANRFQELKNGRGDPRFLRQLALMALRQGDSARAAEICDQFVSRSPQPYTKETWKSIAAMTQSSRGKGFELLSTRTHEANAHLGPHAAEKRILDIIGREIVVPYFRGEQRTADWNEFEQMASTQHGALGREAVRGARMMEALLKQDWMDFGMRYLRYFETAIPTSPYSRLSLSYQVLQYVTDERVLEMAVRVMEWQIASEREHPVFGQYDPSEIDTYAGLLYKVGRKDEAIQWQERAFGLSDGRDADIASNLRRMKVTCSSESTPAG